MPFCERQRLDLELVTTRKRTTTRAPQRLPPELKGVGGLKPLSEVSVTGKLDRSADGKVVTVDATELYVKQWRAPAPWSAL